MKMDFRKIAVLSAATFALVASNSQAASLVECSGVSKSGAAILMTKDMCDKIDGSKATPIAEKDYVQCYGVAKAGQNACATKTSSCGGKSTKARDPNAWVSLPKIICDNLKGGVAKKSQ